MPQFMVITLQGGYVFDNSIDHDIIEIYSIFQTPVEFLKPREHDKSQEYRKILINF